MKQRQLTGEQPGLAGPPPLPDAAAGKQPNPARSRRRFPWRRALLAGGIVALIAVAAYMYFGGGYDAWNFTIFNASGEDFLKVTVQYNGDEFSIAQAGRGGMSEATLPGDMPREADIVLVSLDGAKQNTVHVQIPRPPPLDRNAPYYSGIPRVYFIIHSPVDVEVSFKNPRFAGVRPN